MSDERKDGGPAFPCVTRREMEHSMSMRQFYKAAMTIGLLAQMPETPTYALEKGWPAKFVKGIGEWADLLLEEDRAWAAKQKENDE